MIILRSDQELFVTGVIQSQKGRTFLKSNFWLNKRASKQKQKIYSQVGDFKMINESLILKYVAY